MLNALRVRNFRSFSNAEQNAYVDIKPLTVLVGKNSSGKSSFLRSFPLLRQSVETETTGPILWYGSYVDFGAYSEVKNNDLDDEQIHFDFKLTLNSNDFRRYSTRYRRTFSREIGFESDIDLIVSISVGEENKKTVAKEVNITLGGEVFKFTFQKQDKGTFHFDGSEVAISYISGNQFIPQIGRFTQRKMFLANGEERILKQFDEEYLSEYLFKNDLSKLREFFHYNTSNEKIRDGLDKIGFCNKDSLELILNYAYSDNSVFIRNLNKNKNKVIDVFYNAIIRVNILEILGSINRELNDVF
ncbi:hypothetical protein DLH84_24680, partial [Vibrio parahaemolyticus]|nr:hypothetical protein [Vibrio parahaemolyticus]